MYVLIHRQYMYCSSHSLIPRAMAYILFYVYVYIYIVYIVHIV